MCFMSISGLTWKCQLAIMSVILLSCQYYVSFMYHSTCKHKWHIYKCCLFLSGFLKNEQKQSVTSLLGYAKNEQDHNIVLLVISNHKSSFHVSSLQL